MKKIALLLISVSLLWACGGNPTEKKQNQLKKYQKQVVELNQKITELEEELSKDTSLVEEVYRVSVSTKEMLPIKFEHIISVNGTIEAEKDAYISPEMNGQIKRIYVKEGQRVSRGQLLVKLNTEVTEKSIEELKTGLQLATLTYNRQKELWDQKIGSEMQYLNAKNAKESLELKLETLNAQLKMAKVRAPFSGIIDEIYQKEGEIASPGRQVVQLVNLNSLIVNADVSETYLSKIKKGDNVTVSFPAYPDDIRELKVHRTGNTIKRDNRTFSLQVKLDNKGERLKPNNMVNMKMVDYMNEAAFTVPSLIIKRDVNDNFFLFVTEEGENGLIAKKIFVEPGISSGTETEILKGIEEGQQVIVEGYNLVSNGQKIQLHQK